MIKKFLKNRVVLNTIVLFSFIYITEMFIRFLTEASFTEFAVVRIFLSTLIVSMTISFLGHFLPKLGERILNIIVVLGIGIYGFAQFGLYNYIGFFMGAGNTEQGTKVLSYIMDFLTSLSVLHWMILLPMILFIVYYIVIDRKIYKNYERNKDMKFSKKVIIEVITLSIILVLSGVYYFTIRSKQFQNELQTESNYSLWLYPENSNLTVNNFGVLMYGFADMKSLVLGIDANYVAKIEAKYNKSDKKEEKPKEDIVVPVDYTRTIDDTAWNSLIANTKDENLNNLNNYFINRTITPKNDMTGMFEGKNLIIILMESVNEIAILNQEYFPTLYKMYHEGISFTNNYTPRNNCSTGNNELTALSSLFTINNTCTARTYRNNKYFEGAFNIFRNKGYYAVSFHDYTEHYYPRTKLHTALGSQKFYSVTDLGIPYNDKYEEWPSDVDMFKQAQKYYMNEDQFFVYFAAVTTHQTYNVPSELGDKYRSKYEKLGYSKTLSRYLSKMQVFDEAMEELLSELEAEGKLEDTVIAMFGDHFPYGLADSQINEFLKANNAGYTVSRNSTTNKYVDRTPMLIYNSAIEPITVSDYTTIIDLLPTLFNLFNLDYDPRLYLGTDIFSETHASRAVFSDGSWADERGYYHAPNSKMTYLEGATEYASDDIVSVNKEISTRQKMSASAIQTNYFKYLGEGLEKYKVVAKPEEDEVTDVQTEVQE